MKTIQLSVILAGLMGCAAAVAEPASKVAWTLDTLHLLAGGKATNGEKLAQSCVACHTVEPAGEMPKLQGQTAAYLYKQLHDYKDGSRAHDIMGPMAQGLSDQDMADLAAWYASQPAPTARLVAPASDAVEKLVGRGDGTRILAPCATCHGGDGRGASIDNPSLAGQNAQYVEQTLAAYQAGTRHNDVYGRMRLIAKQLSADEIKGLALYYSGLVR